MYAFLGLIVAFGLVLFVIERVGGGSNAIQESLDAHSYPSGQEDVDSAGTPEQPASVKTDPCAEPVPDPAKNT